MTTTLIKSFWEWFANNAYRMNLESASDAFLAELDEQVVNLGDFAWEIGPGFHKENQFVLSPHGDKEILKQTRDVIGKAPVMDKWEFYPARQPLQGNLVFVLNTDPGEISFDATNWQYILYQFHDGTFDIILKAPNIAALSPADQSLAARLAIDGAIGEEKRIELFVDIEVVEAFEDGEKPLAPTLPLLPDHLKQLFKMS
ncbi:MAG: hypothetical protein ABW007_18750 [Chitinophagaceae bacterium]